MKYCMHCMQTLLETDTECQFCGQAIQVDYSPHHIIPGTILNNRYLIGKVIGQGGFGITYIGLDLKLNMKIALKEYYPNGYVSRSNNVSLTVNCNASESEKAFFEKGRERFLGEAQVLAKFRNEQGIVSVIDFFEDNNTAYIVMEYLEGEDLKEYLKEKGTISAEQIISWMMPVMNTLEKIHGQGLIHRDISPDNIRVVENGLKLMDFGAARVISSAAKKSLSVMLKPGYAPYEQYYSDGEQGCWTDVYALCATLYKCITGITPPEAPGRTRNDSLKTPSALGIEIDSVIERSIMKGLSVWPEDRFQTIAELLQGFQGKFTETEEDGETEYHPAGSGEGWEGKPVESDSTNGSVPTGPKVVEGERKVQDSSVKKESDKLPESLDEPKKKRKIIWIILLILALLGIGTGIVVFASGRNQTDGEDKKTSLSLTSTPEPTKAETPVPTATSTPQPTITSMPELTVTSIPESTATNTPIPTATSTPVPTVTNTPIPTATSTPVPTVTNTPIPTATSTPAPTATNAPTPIPHVHDYSWKTSVTKQATCTETGEEKNLCSCGDYLLETIPAKGHSEVTVSGRAATCTETGLTDGKKCSVCGIMTVKQTTIAAKGHSEVTVSGKAATCTETGLTDGKKCSVCGTMTVKQTTIAAKGHSEVIVPGESATCTASGLTDGKRCSTCGTVTVKQTTIAAKGHSEVTVSGKAATCTETGLTDGKKCSTCGTVTVAQKRIAAKGHSEVTVSGKAATCTTTGLTDGKKCSTCGTVTAAQQTIAAKGHSEVTVSGKTATCTATGLTDGKKCSTCGTVTVAQQTIAAKGHSYSNDSDLDCNNCGYVRGYWSEYGEWSAWQDTPISGSISCDVETQDAIVGYNKKTVWHYERWVSDPHSDGYERALEYYTSACYKYEEKTVEEPLSYDKYTTKKGEILYGWGFNDDGRWIFWYNEEERQVDDHTSPIYKKQYRYRTRKIVFY